MSAAGYVLAAVCAVYRGEWQLAKWMAREAVLARAREAWDAP